MCFLCFTKRDHTRKQTLKHINRVVWHILFYLSFFNDYALPNLSSTKIQMIKTKLLNNRKANLCKVSELQTIMTNIW